MNRDGHKNIAFFVGPEVEHTPAFSKKTLFVVGAQDIDAVLKHANEHKVAHIFIGANHSFMGMATHYVEKTVTSLLDKGFWVTLEYPAYLHVNVLKILNSEVWQNKRFVPLLSVEIPNVETSSSNLTVKIDDVDFKATNRGVWCMNVHEVTDSNRFTDWIEYGNDVVIQAESVKADFANPLKIEQLNDASLGLDPDSPSKLKPESLEELVSKITPANVHKELFDTPASAAEAYAEGTTKDPLSSKPAKKAPKK